LHGVGLALLGDKSDDCCFIRFRPSDGVFEVEAVSIPSGMAQRVVRKVNIPRSTINQVLDKLLDLKIISVVGLVGERGIE
jgi:hypothetical protein